MSEVSESKDMQLEKSGEIRNPSIPETDRPKLPETKDGKDTNNTPFQPDTDIYNDIFKKSGLISENSESQANESQSDSGEKDNDYSEHLEKGDDGKYYAKETGKAYDSVEQWVKEQETLAKRYEGTAKYYEDKAKKEWARFKNADQNGETDAEKWEHYRKSQEYYAKAKECKEKAAHIGEKLGNSNVISNEAVSLNTQDTILGTGMSNFDTLPKEKQEVINNSFRDAPNEIKALVDVLSKYLSVETVKESDTVRVSNYSFLDKTIRMKPDMSDDEYSEVFTHEYGHFVDDMLGRPSGTAEFRNAMNMDLMRYAPDTAMGMKNFERMMSDLLNSDAAYDRMVSDILSAFFVNDPAVRQRYEAEGFPCFGHTDEYWSRPGAREAEVFANSFSVATQDNSDSCAFIKNYFPNTWKQMMNILKGGA